MTDSAAFQQTWVVKSRGHSFLSHYAILLYDLTSVANSKPILYLEGATHEFCIISLDPEFKEFYPNGLDSKRELLTLQDKIGRSLFISMEHCYQVRTTDKAITQELAMTIGDISAGRLYCDSDFYLMWDNRFPNAHSLRKG